MEKKSCCSFSIRNKFWNLIILANHLDKSRKSYSLAHRRRCFWRGGRLLCTPCYSPRFLGYRPLQLRRQQLTFPRWRPFFHEQDRPLIIRLQPRPTLRRQFLGRNFQHCDFLRVNDETVGDGVYSVEISGRSENVYCQFEPSGRNWLVITAICIL